MTKRKQISPKIRFEVLKRDSFTCQYCGKKAPDVVLEIDHIKPVAKGGANEIMNYVTSCKCCNIGKGAREIGDQSELAMQRKAIEELQERRNQIELMLKWKKSLSDAHANEAELISEHITEATGWDCSNAAKSELKKLIKRFGFEIVFDSTEAAYEQYFHYNGDREKEKSSWCHAFGKIGAIAYNKKNPAHAHKNYCLSVLKNRIGYVNSGLFYVLYGQLMDLASGDSEREALKDEIMRECKAATSWNDIKQRMSSAVEMMGGE